MIWADCLKLLKDDDVYLVMVNGEPKIKVQFYVTEQPDRLYLEFDISYDCEGLCKNMGSPGKLDIIKGSCTYHTEEKQYDDFWGDKIVLKYKTNDGEYICKRTVYGGLVDSIVLGHKMVEHSIKYKLND